MRNGRHISVEPAGRQSRRRWIQAALTAGGCGLSLADVARLRAASPAAVANADTSVIQIWLGGGPSQFETFDPKPDAPSEIRGPFQPIATTLPGVAICEKLPLTAQLLHRCALIRSFALPTDDHFIATHWCVSGYPGLNNQPSHPSNGAIAAHFRSARSSGIPAYALLQDSGRNTEIERCMGTGHLNQAHAPFVVVQDWMRNEFQEDTLRRSTANLWLADDISLARMTDRRSFLGGIDSQRRQLDNVASRAAEFDEFERLAMEMVIGGEARAAFDLQAEPAATRERYGRHRWGQMTLLARRLVEAGTAFVTVNLAPDSLCWDWHRNIVEHHGAPDDGTGRGMNVNGPPLDHLLHGLIHDLYERGLDQRVLVVVWGEFGRTPVINATGGRDHWGKLASMLLIGGGLRMGQVIGASNPRGEHPTDRPVGPTDVLATIYQHLGIDPAAVTRDASGRPIHVLPDGQFISELA